MNQIKKRAIVGGVVSTIVMGTGAFILGQISGYKAMELLKNSMSGINMLCNTVILGSTTILALMLTLLGLSRSSESRLTDRHYKDVLMIAKSDTILIVVAVITFLMLNLPISESEEVGSAWYQTIYYVSRNGVVIRRRFYCSSNDALRHHNQCYFDRWAEYKETSSYFY